MIGLRRLADGKWNKDPVLAAARAILARGLGRSYRRVPLGSIATFVNGTSYDVGLLGTGPTPIIRISNITDPGSEFIETSERFAPKFQVSAGDLLVSWSASFKSILWPGPPGILNQHIFKVVEDRPNQRSYVRHAIEAAFDQMQQNVVGIGMMHLRRRDFLGQVVPCPPADIQAAVGAYLDWMEGACGGPEPSLPGSLVLERTVIDELRRVATKLEVCTRLRGDAAVATDSLLGASLNEMSARFVELSPLECVLVGNPRNGWSPQCDGAVDGVAVLTLSAVTGFRYKAEAFKRTSLPVVKGAHYWLQPGDLLMTRSNTAELVGHAAIYDGNPQPCIYPDLMMRIRLDLTRVDTRFCWFWLQTPLVREFVMKEAKGTSPTMKKISQGTVMAVPYPADVPMSEQRAIVRSLDELVNRTEGVRAIQESTDSALTAMVPSLIDRLLEDPPH